MPYIWYWCVFLSPLLLLHLLLIIPKLLNMKGVFPFIIAASLIFLSAHTVNTKKTSPIDGAWKLVWAKSDETVIDAVKNPQIKFFADGCFSLLASNAEGKIDYAGYGTFELDGTSYYETFMYHNNPDYTGAMDWQQIEVRGDTMYAKGFIKVIVKGKEVTKDFPVIEEKRVRMP